MLFTANTNPPMPTTLSTTPKGYRKLLQSLKQRIHNSQFQAAVSVNRELIRSTLSKSFQRELPTEAEWVERIGAKPLSGARKKGKGR